MFRNANAFRLASALAAPVLLLAGAAVAQDVYQWKDAQGVTHYSEAPPSKGSYQQRNVNRDRVTATTTAGAETAAEPAPAPAPTRATVGRKDTPSAQCVTARQNLSLLESKGAVQQDVDGDGKPDKTLDDKERINQLELARAQLKAQNCGA